MTDFKNKYSAEYDEKTIRSEYQEDVNLRILRVAKYATPLLVLAGGAYFVYSDIFIRHITYITPWRIPTFIVGFIFLALIHSKFRQNSKLIFFFHNLVLFSISFMSAGITWSLFESELFKSSLNGIMVVIFGHFIVTYGGFRILIIHYSLLFVSMIIIYFYYSPPITKMAEFANVIIIMVLCLIASQFEENLRFKEFRFRKIAEFEKERAYSLLLNILPEEIAEEIKVKGKVTAKKFENVTVMFTDFVKFTSMAESISPEKLVKSLDYYFSSFDEIIEKYKLEKIKTIGDAYMCVGGLPTHLPQHAFQVAMAALEIAEFVEKSNTNIPDGIQKFQIRIGIQTGTVIAGIVGVNKFQYDIWGDTVNIASRMETASEVGQINITEATYLQIKDNFECVFRGSFDVKNHEALKMYFLHRRNSSKETS